MNPSSKPQEQSSLVLASQSPRRRALLTALGVEFEVRVSGVDEDEHQQCGGVRAGALKTALAKARQVATQCEENRLILAADTIVALDGTAFNKPIDREDARRMLRTLAGRRHSVVTAVALLRVGGEALLDSVEARVRFQPLDEELIERYVESGEADDKAGAYGIQGLGARLVADVEGDITGVIGLPVMRLNAMAAEMTGTLLFEEACVREVVCGAFPELRRLPEHCLAGLPA